MRFEQPAAHTTDPIVDQRSSGHRLVDLARGLPRLRLDPQLMVNSAYDRPQPDQCALQLCFARLARLEPADRVVADRDNQTTPEGTQPSDDRRFASGHARTRDRAAGRPRFLVTSLPQAAHTPRVPCLGSTKSLVSVGTNRVIA